MESVQIITRFLLVLVSARTTILQKTSWSADHRRKNQILEVSRRPTAASLAACLSS